PRASPIPGARPAAPAYANASLTCATSWHGESQLGGETPFTPCETSLMGLPLLVFIGVAAIVIIIPGPDTAVVTKNVLIHGRRAGLGTSLGVSTGLAIWTIAAAVGLASLVRASEVAFTALKLAGALYLVWLGVQALRAAGDGATAQHTA